MANPTSMVVIATEFKSFKQIYVPSWVFIHGSTAQLRTWFEDEFSDYVEPTRKKLYAVILNERKLLGIDF